MYSNHKACCKVKKEVDPPRSLAAGLLHMIAIFCSLDFQPFSVVEDKGFIDLLDFVYQQGYDIKAIFRKLFDLGLFMVWTLEASFRV